VAHGGEKSGYAVVLMEPRSGVAVGLHHHDGNPGVIDTGDPVPYSVVVFRDPDNIQLELIYMAG
jgi:hypothetical protein